MLNSIPGDQQRNYRLFRDYLATALPEKISEPEAKPRRRTKTKSKKRATVPPPSHKNPISNENYNDVNSQDPGLEDRSTGLRREGNTAEDTAEVTVPNDDLADFTDYIAAKTFACPPQELKTTDYYDYIASGALPAQYALPLTGADISTHLPNLDPGIADSLSAYGIINEETQGTEEFLAPVLSISHESLHSPATTEHTPRRRLQDLRPRPDPPLVPPSHPMLRTRQGDLPRMAPRVRPAEHGVAL
ncbi:hypothetical protein F5X98DRAFT_124327 [Xylaria grammica]|nr:hypothetical protein F5X98DRAFT_124327 [Xylaria grammica]